MSKPDQNLSRGMSDALGGVIDSIAKFLMVAGLAALVIGVGFLIYTATQSLGLSGDLRDQALRNIELFSKVAIVGGLCGALGVTWIMWGEETLGVILLLAGGAFYAAPYYMPGAFNISDNDISDKALVAVSNAGMIVGVIGVLVVLADLIIRVRIRVQEGARAEQLKFGKGIKEERDIRNVFLGKCWQLPYCRKFVRERCPIYHSRRTCWQERVGCMCDESVIQNAMEGKVIPSDVVAAAKFIPKNSKLTPGQKAERCRQCIIYNEHQKHKYQLALPLTGIVLIGIYAALHNPLKEMVDSMLVSADSAMGKASFQDRDVTNEVTSLKSGVIPYAEIILVAFFLIAFAYIVRVLEYLVFKVKV